MENEGLDTQRLPHSDVTSSWSEGHLSPKGPVLFSPLVSWKAPRPGRGCETTHFALPACCAVAQRLLLSDGSVCILWDPDSPLSSP